MVQNATKCRKKMLHVEPQEKKKKKTYKNGGSGGSLTLLAST